MVVHVLFNFSMGRHFAQKQKTCDPLKKGGSKWFFLPFSFVKGSMAKRLRGWQLDAEIEKVTGKREKKEPLEKGESHLCTALLSLWAHGHLSAVAIRKLAEAAMLDGAAHEELADLAKAGHYGEVAGNCHRDILARFVKHNSIPEPLEIEVPVLDPKSLKIGKEMAAIFLPHIMFSQLATLPNFHEVFPLEKVERFWNLVEKSQDERLINHPIRTHQWKTKTIPLWVHGDGVEYGSTNNLMCWSWGPMMTNFSPLEAKFLLACFPKSCTAPGTWPSLMKYICWSFNSLVKGDHPTHDPDGKPLKKGSLFYDLKGKPLATGYKAVIWSIQGDQEFFSNHLLLPHWTKKNPCHECDCNSDESCPSKYFKTIEMERQALVKVTNAQAAEKPASKHELFNQIPGLTTKFVRGDILHILYCHGLFSHLLGSILHYLCYNDGPGRQKVPAEKRLGLLWASLQKEYSNLRSPTRLTNLRLTMFTDPGKPHSSHPALNCKGSEARHFLPPFLKLCKGLLNKEIWHEAAMLECMQNMQDLMGIFDKADVVPTAAEHKEAMTLGKGFLDHYSMLHTWALEEGKHLFHIVHKFHTFQHLLENSKHLNPAACWCFANEDFVGRISQLVFSSSSGVRSTRLSSKMAPKYRVLLHLLLTRDNFSLGEEAWALEEGELQGTLAIGIRMPAIPSNRV